MKKLFLIACCAALLLSLGACRHTGCGKTEDTTVVPTQTEQSVPAPVSVPEVPMPAATK